MENVANNSKSTAVEQAVVQPAQPVQKEESSIVKYGKVAGQFAKSFGIQFLAGFIGGVVAYKVMDMMESNLSDEVSAAPAKALPSPSEPQLHLVSTSEEALAA